MNRERVYLVDKDDVVIGEKWRDELVDSDCWRIIGVWVTDHDGNILLQQRSMNKKVGPGLWSTACEGTVEINDSYEETAVRELEEEVGISNVELKPLSQAHFKSVFGWRIDHTYVCVIDRDTPITIQESEVAQVKWFTPDELRAEMAKNPSSFVVPHMWDKLFGFS